MLPLKLFEDLGLFVREDCLSADECEGISGEMESAPSRAGTVGRGANGDFQIDPSERKVDLRRVSDDTYARINLLYEEIQPQLEAHYGLKLDGFEPPSFLDYGPGDFYVAHKDSHHEKSVSTSRKQRRISALIFLGDQSTPEHGGAFTGGDILFYGLWDHPAVRELGLPISARAGLLVSFRPDVFHEVTPVETGRRRAVVTWYY